jgi:hypothetical protein
MHVCLYVYTCLQEKHQQYGDAHWAEGGENTESGTTYGIGSYQRFESFIHWMLQFDGSGTLLRRSGVMDHIVSQSGTLMASRALTEQGMTTSVVAAPTTAGLGTVNSTVYTATVNEISPPSNRKPTRNIFKLEELSAAFKSIAADSHVPAFDQFPMSEFDKQFKHSATTRDELRTSAMAKKYFRHFLSVYNNGSELATKNPAEINIFETTLANSTSTSTSTSNTTAGPENRQETPKADSTTKSKSGQQGAWAQSFNTHMAATADEEYRVRRSYFRALCRIYLVDFACANYTLPAACQDMAVELEHSYIMSHYGSCTFCLDNKSSPKGGSKCC